MNAYFDSGDSMTDDKDNPGFVRVADCRERHGKIELAFWGPDGIAGMVKDIADIKNYIEQADAERKEKKMETKEGIKAWKALALSIIGGAVVAIINFIIRK